MPTSGPSSIAARSTPIVARGARPRPARGRPRRGRRDDAPRGRGGCRRTRAHAVHRAGRRRAHRPGGGDRAALDLHALRDRLRHDRRPTPTARSTTCAASATRAVGCSTAPTSATATSRSASTRRARAARRGGPRRTRSDRGDHRPVAAAEPRRGHRDLRARAAARDPRRPARLARDRVRRAHRRPGGPVTLDPHLAFARGDGPRRRPSPTTASVRRAPRPTSSTSTATRSAARRVSAIERVERFLREDWGGRLIRGWDESWMQLPFEIGDRIGRAAIGAKAGQTVIGDSTTVLLYKLARAAVDAQLAARPGAPRDRGRQRQLPHRPLRARGHRRASAA